VGPCFPGYATARSDHRTPKYDRPNDETSANRRQTAGAHEKLIG